jgi:hypothetical protein
MSEAVYGFFASASQTGRQACRRDPAPPRLPRVTSIPRGSHPRVCLSTPPSRTPWCKTCTRRSWRTCVLCGRSTWHQQSHTWRSCCYRLAVLSLRPAGQETRFCLEPVSLACLTSGDVDFWAEEYSSFVALVWGAWLPRNASCVACSAPGRSCRQSQTTTTVNLRLQTGGSRQLQDDVNNQYQPLQTRVRNIEAFNFVLFPPKRLSANLISAANVKKCL